MRIVLSCFLLLMILGSCRDSHPQEKSTSYMDSVISDYIQLCDSSGQYDLTNPEHKLLRAYAKRDTAYFKLFSLELAEEKKARVFWAYRDSCVSQKKLTELGADIAYRFEYVGAPCRYEIRMTISKKGSNINMNYLLYRPALRHDTPCRVLINSDEAITKEDWDRFLEAIQQIDFWALKKHNDTKRCGGGGIAVTGYEKGDTSSGIETRYSYVSRWAVENNLSKPFILLLTLAGKQEGVACALYCLQRPY